MSRTLLASLAGVAVACAIGFGTNFALVAAGSDTALAPWGVGVAVGTFTSLAIVNAGRKRKVTVADAAARKAALALAPSPGKALLLVFREGFMGKRNGVDLRLDGRDLTQLMSPRFTAVELAPGQYKLEAVLAGALNAASTPGEALFSLAAGEVAMFRITLKLRMSTSDIVLARVEAPASVVGKLARMKMIAPARQAL